MDAAYTVQSTMLQALLDHILVPIIAAIGIALIFIIKPRIDRISKSIVARNEMDHMAKKNTIHKEILEMIDNCCEQAVAANMQLADAIKKEEGHIDDEQAARLNKLARDTVYGSLPPSVTEEGGSMLEIIGGRTKLDTIIDASMEKHVIEYKIRRPSIKKKEVDVEPEPVQEAYDPDVPPMEYEPCQDTEEYPEYSAQEEYVESPPIQQTPPVANNTMQNIMKYMRG